MAYASAYLLKNVCYSRTLLQKLSKLACQLSSSPWGTPYTMTHLATSMAACVCVRACVCVIYIIDAV